MQSVTIIDCHTTDGEFLDCCTLGDNDPGAMLRRESHKHGAVVLSVRVGDEMKTVAPMDEFIEWMKALG